MKVVHRLFKIYWTVIRLIVGKNLLEQMINQIKQEYKSKNQTNQDQQHKKILYICFSLTELRLKHDQLREAKQYSRLDVHRVLKIPI